MDEEYELLIEKEEIWTKMYVQLLEQNGIKCMLIPVNGMGLSMKTGIQDFLRIYVLSSDIEKAKHIMKESFNGKLKFWNITEGEWAYIELSSINRAINVELDKWEQNL